MAASVRPSCSSSRHVMTSALGFDGSARPPPRSSAARPRPRRRAAAPARGRSGFGRLVAPGRSGGAARMFAAQLTQSPLTPRPWPFGLVLAGEAALRPLHELAHRLGRRGHEGQDARVVHARGPDDAHGAGRLAVRGVRAPDDGELAAAQVPRLLADDDVPALALDRHSSSLTSFSRASSAVTSCRTWPGVVELGLLEQLFLALDDHVRLAAHGLARLRRPPSRRRACAARRPARARCAAAGRRGRADRRGSRPSTTSSSRLWMRCSSCSLMRHLEEAVLHRAALHHEHGEHLVARSPDETQLLEHERLGARGDDDGGGARELREQLARLAHHVLPGREGRELLVDRCLLVRRQRAHLHQRVDEEAERAVGGHAAGARVRLAQVPHLLEVGEHVADARGRQIEPRLLRERARPHGLTGRHVLGDAVVEDLAGAGVQLRHWAFQSVTR